MRIYHTLTCNSRAESAAATGSVAADSRFYAVQDRQAKCWLINHAKHLMLDESIATTASVCLSLDVRALVCFNFIPTLRQAYLWERPKGAMCVRKSSVRRVLQFTPLNAASCVLHRPANRVIHRLQSCFVLSFMFYISICYVYTILNMGTKLTLDGSTTRVLIKSGGTATYTLCVCVCTHTELH
jgi:hypothetical protein